MNDGINWRVISHQWPLVEQALRKFIDKEYQPSSKFAYKNDPVSSFIESHGENRLSLIDSFDIIELKLQNQVQ